MQGSFGLRESTGCGPSKCYPLAQVHRNGNEVRLSWSAVAVLRVQVYAVGVTCVGPVACTLTVHCIAEHADKNRSTMPGTFSTERSPSCPGSTPSGTLRCTPFTLCGNAMCCCCTAHSSTWVVRAAPWDCDMGAELQFGLPAAMLLQKLIGTATSAVVDCVYHTACCGMH